MAIRDEIGDPWGVVVAGVAGGLAWAVGLPVLAVAGIGGAVYGVKVLGGLLTGRGRRRAEDAPGRVLPVARGSNEEFWHERARRAHRAFTEIAASAPPGAVRERVRGFEPVTEAALTSLRQLAGQASAVGYALARIDPHRLAAEAERLSGSGGRFADRSRAAVEAQLQSRRRLEEARAELLDRMESGTLGLESLVARLTEVVALAQASAAGGHGTAELDAIAAELEGLRAGLVEAEEVTSRVIEGLPPRAARRIGEPRRRVAGGSVSGTDGGDPPH